MSMLSVHTLMLTMGPNACVDLDTRRMDIPVQVRSLKSFNYRLLFLFC